MKKRKTNRNTRIQARIIFGVVFCAIALFIGVSIISYLFTWKEDQSQLIGIADRSILVKNLMGKIGAAIGHILVFKTFGIASLIIIISLFIVGVKLLFQNRFTYSIKSLLIGIVLLFWLPMFLDFISATIYGGGLGKTINNLLEPYIGKLGISLLIILVILILIITSFRSIKFKKPNSFIKKIDKLISKTRSTIKNNTKSKLNPEEVITYDKDKLDRISEIETKTSLEDSQLFRKDKNTLGNSSEKNLEIVIEKTTKEKLVKENLSNKLLEKYGKYDPKIDLESYRFPPLDLLNDYNNSHIKVDQNELEINKNRIVETLNNYKIGISSIKATIGPTVTLYEIIPDAGIRISKIKNLEDDIALSLSALGIRIIAPIPGKGTIGIEVPNGTPTIVSIKSVLSSEKFQKTKMELPVALGKTISNETLIFDLAKMPHLLMAGATGQGKSVGLNAVITSLLFKKHPAELKFIFFDPKKVELTLYNKIERHFLAKLPEVEECIITDNKMVVNTLNSLCIEMDNRYELLKTAMVRNIKEYNNKFKDRRLNPEKGHMYLPYIVVVIDEFADLIMTAGKEVETPLARIAQLARAIGIHLIIATQRPSVNVITGLIKANFPARIAFRVTSKIDSRTILDTGGADQLIGRGDMLLSTGSDLVRLQCAFVDTPEVEEITEFIGSQRGFSDAFLLPEFVADSSSPQLNDETQEKDPLFRDAAHVIVQHQQGSASLLQRKLKLGYNRAGRLIDQLESAGIVGPFEGSKARQVLISDISTLESFLSNLDQ